MVKEPPAKRACDRCHAVKEKCRWIDNLGTCERCQRLRSQCQTLRPIRTPGRKPRYPRVNPVGCCASRSSSISGSDSNSPPGILGRKTPELYLIAPQVGNVPRTLSVLVDLSKREREILYGIPQGRTPFGHFLVAPSFHRCHLEAFVRHLREALPFLKDSLLAATALLKYEYDPKSVDLDQTIGHKRAASAVRSLRALNKFDSSELSTVLILGVTAITFSINITGNALEICRHTLNLVKPAYESLDTLDFDSASFIVCLIYAELEDCLLLCEMPTVRFKPQENNPVDRFFGVSTPMLPYLYDIGVISHSLHYGVQGDHLAMIEALDAVERAIEQWSPALPEDTSPFVFSDMEVMSIMTQAKIVRWSMLLMCHRIRYPYGTETTRGSALADAILGELSLVVQRTNRAVPGTTFQFMIACFEIVDDVKRRTVLQKLSDLSELPKQVLTRIRAQLRAAWALTDSQDVLRWYDLCPRLPR